MKRQMIAGTLAFGALALAASGTLGLGAPDGRRVGVIREAPDGRVDLFDQESRWVGWGHRKADGSIELFHPDGQRLGTITRDGKRLRTRGALAVRGQR